jgi:hypothetical protein
MKDLALIDQIPRRARDVLYGDLGVDPVLVEQIDGLDPQPPERLLGDLPDMFGSAVQERAALHAACVAGGIETELGPYGHLPPEGLQGLANQLFIDEGAVNFGGVEEGDAPFHRGADQRDHLLFVGRGTVGEAHAHAAHAHGRHLQAVGSQCSRFHACLPAVDG